MRFVKHRYRVMAGILVCLLLGGCYFFQFATQPMPSQRFEANQPATGLIVLMPGFGDGPRHYVKHGFVDTVRAANPAFDVVAVNAHFGYYRNFSVVDRLHEDIIEPLRERYDAIWLVGISMGGLGAAIYTMSYPDNVDGMILLAPFMGSEEVVEEVMSAGSLGRWTPPDLSTIEDDRDRRYYELWTFYQGYVTDPGRKPGLYLGFGDQDHLRGPNAFVAEVLKPEQSLVLSGGHKWRVWKPLFAELANRAITDENLAASADSEAGGEL